MEYYSVKERNKFESRSSEVDEPRACFQSEVS